jgi:hypothetical protein
MHKVNTIYKREAIAFTKDNINFHSSLNHHPNVTSKLHDIRASGRNEPNYQKQKGHENLVLMPRVTFEVISYQATC